MAKLIRIDEFGAYLTSQSGSDNPDFQNDDMELSPWEGRTDDEYVIADDALLEGC